jgi:deoxyadenosine/deoxycytidine kinase
VPDSSQLAGYLVAYPPISLAVTNFFNSHSMDKSPLIGIVGPCGAGKSTLAANLTSMGFSVRHIAQEHSYVPTMWQRITNPDVLVYIDVSYENTLKRRSLDWTEGEYQEQLFRLRHARQYADFYLDTNPLDQTGVFQAVLSWLKDQFNNLDN